MLHIFLLAGQSNMTGAGITAEIPPEQKTCPANVRLFEDGQWQDLLRHDQFGPEVGLAHELSLLLKDDQIVLCKVAAGGANLYYDWNPDGVSRGPEDLYRGPLYPILSRAIATITSELSAAGTPGKISGLFWMQGERDSVFEFMAESYEKNLTDFIANVRTNAENRELPVILGKISPRVYSLKEKRFQHPFRRIVQHAQQAVADADPLVSLVETTDLPQADNLHFDTGGQLELGKRFARAYNT